jgi:hypothetical protein
LNSPHIARRPRFSAHKWPVTCLYSGARYWD